MVSEASRRDVLLGAGVAAGTAAAAWPAAAAPRRPASAADLSRYVGYGGKASGGSGDGATGAWLEQELKGAGFATERLPFSAPWFEPAMAELSTGAHRAGVVPQAIVVPTGAGGVSGPLVRVAPSLVPPSGLAGAIALVDLPAQRWSTALARPIRDTVDAAHAAGAVACVLITNGPTGKALALNTDGRQPIFAKPVAVLAPAEASPFLAAATRGERATLKVAGDGGRRPAWNLIGRIDRGRDRWVAVSTPRSGWFTCAGERGGGVAAWLALARWAPGALRRYNLAFVANSGHEYEYLGAEHTLNGAMPKPEQTALWLHLGAGVAARDWHELAGALRPLPSADPQRVLAVSTALIEPARAAFRGQPGLEAAYDSAGFTAGELSNVIAAGYSPVAGIFGSHRYHHAREDDERCLDAPATDRVIVALQQLLSAVLG